MRVQIRKTFQLTTRTQVWTSCTKLTARRPLRTAHWLPVLFLPWTSTVPPTPATSTSLLSSGYCSSAASSTSALSATHSSGNSRNRGKGKRLRKPKTSPCVPVPPAYETCQIGSELLAVVHGVWAKPHQINKNMRPLRTTVLQLHVAYQILGLVSMLSVQPRSKLTIATLNHGTLDVLLPPFDHELQSVSRRPHVIA
jgi:hypothetical protein